MSIYYKVEAGNTSKFFFNLQEMFDYVCTQVSESAARQLDMHKLHDQLLDAANGWFTGTVLVGNNIKVFVSSVK